MSPNSGIDLLVIKGGDYDPARLTERIYQHLHGAKAAVEVIVVTPEEVERVPERFGPDDPREWLNRARNDLACAPVWLALGTGTRTATIEVIHGRENEQDNLARQVRLLEDLLITQLATAGVPQKRIREIVGCDIYRVVAIAKHVSSAGSGTRRRAGSGKRKQKSV